MAESVKPPLIQEDDENDDLFVSAVEKQPSCDLKSSVTTLDDVGAGSLEEEIDLRDEDDNENASSEVITNPKKSLDKFENQTDEEIYRAKIFSSPVTTNSESTGVKAILTPARMPELKTEQTGPTRQTMEGRKKNVDRFIEIKVGDPQKIGEGMGSFVCFKVNTKTNLPYLPKSNYSVNRRFSDFLGLRDKLCEKHLHYGHIIPPPPEKDVVGTAKVMMSKEEMSTSSEFLVKRAASLERFLNRIAIHPVLQIDPDFIEFIELESDLPRAKNTSALSGAGVRRWFNKMGDTVNKMTFRMDETDLWFEEKQHQIENLDIQLRKLHASVEALIHHRKELTTTTGAFAKSAAMLGNCEEHTALSCALSQLAETEEKIEQLYGEQVNSDFYHLSELLRDYITLIGVVKDIFHQRVKVYQTWQHAQQMLSKKKDAKVKLEQAGKSDRLTQANEEVIEWEAKVSRGQEEFELISKNIKKEVEVFEVNRIKDFKASIIKYMESLLNTQQKLIKYWEAFLPEARAIS